MKRTGWRTWKTWRGAATVALAVAMASGCLFRDAAEPRFFRPQSAMADPGAVVPPDPGGAPVRLRPVEGTPFLRERIVWRTSDVEYGLWEQRRWSELPASYVQRALENALRRAPGVALSEDIRAPSLRVEVVAFDEVLAPARSASISLVVSLRDAKGKRLFDRLFTAETAADGETTAATAVAMGKALDAVAAEVAQTVAGALLTKRL